jgi:hypothetical protein
VVDHAELALGVLRRDQLFDDLRDGVGGRPDGPGAGRAAQRPHAAHDALRPLAGQQRDERLLERNQRVAAHDDLALLREIERHHGDAFGLDVAPDVDLGPVREREDADALARPDAAVQELPELRSLVLGIPLPVGVAKREDPFLGARALLVAPRAAESGVEVAGLERVEQRLGFQRAAAGLGPHKERLRPVSDRLGVGVDDQPGADLGRVPIAELDHLAELVRGVDVQQRERNGPRMKRLLREAQQNRRVLADRVQHDGPLELGHHLAHDVDALGLQRAEVIGGPCARRVGRPVCRCIERDYRHRSLGGKQKSPGCRPRALVFSAAKCLADFRYVFGKTGSAGTMTVPVQQHAHSRAPRRIDSDLYQFTAIQSTFGLTLSRSV